MLPGHPPSIVNGQEVYDRYPENDLTFYGNAVNVGHPSYAIAYLATTDPDAIRETAAMGWKRVV